MSKTAIFINLFTIGCLFFALIKDRNKTKTALKIALKAFIRILPTVFMIIIFIGLLMGLVPQSQISKVVGEKAGLRGVLIVAVLGSVLHIPSIISFPLAASLLRSGASLTSVAVFITTLTMIGVVTLPLEIKELGRQMALLRNGLSFILALIIGLIMGAVL